MTRIGIAALLLTLVAGCDDPAKGQAKANAAAPVASTAGAQASGTTFVIEPATSKIEWTGSKVTGHHDGSFGTFKGAVTLVDGAVEKSRVTVEIDTPSLTAAPENLLKHLKTPDFFNVDAFPKATFASTSIKKGAPDKPGTYDVTGNLTLHGITKSISFPATITVAGDTVNADATFSINRKDFSINYPGKVDDVIRDDVLVKLTIHAPKQP
jgi:polyisoprenoid-binding protein YceI